MEYLIILILVIVILLMKSGQNARFDELNRTLKSIEQQLYSLRAKQFQRPEEEKTKPQAESQAAKQSPEVFTKPQTIVDAKPEPKKEEAEKPVGEKKPEVFNQPKEEVIRPEVKKPEERVAASASLYRTQTPPVKVVEESWYAKFRKNNPDLENFIGENILSKVAITILVLGIAFFVKYAIDKDWINEVARVGIGMLAGSIVLAFAHRLRSGFKAFSSVLVAGGVSIFYFTIGIGFHEYQVFTQPVAFVLMLLVTAFTVFISVAYDRIEIAVLSIVGGFGTPFMVSTGAGNYQVLFTYVLILDLGMLILAYMRKWNLVNILTYVFTMILYVSWLESKVIHRPSPPYFGALLFGSAFYIIFIAMNMINNVKARRQFQAVEISILLSNTFIFYACGMQILSYYHPEFKGLFSILIALVNMLCAWLLFKRYKADTNLVYMLIGLTLTFITIAVPVQLEGNYITLVWAVESVLVMWLGIRSGIALYRFSSIVLLMLMMFSLFLDWNQIYQRYSDLNLMIIANKGFLTGLVSAASILATGVMLKKEIKDSGNRDMQIEWFGMSFRPFTYSAVLQILFVCLLYVVGILELSYQLDRNLTVSVAYYIIMMTYHLLFLCLLNVVPAKYTNTDLSKTLLLLNLASVVVFLVGFSILPIFDYKENIVRPEPNYIGFIFHYIVLAAAMFLSLRAYTRGKVTYWDNFEKPLLFTMLLASAIVYLCSIELILHIAHLRLDNPLTDTQGEETRILTSYYTLQRHVIKAGFPILWGLLAFGFLFFGMKKHLQTFRVAALCLIALTVLKLFLYDIRTTSEGGKILAFIILGVVLLIISFMYQKIKVLIIEGRTEDKNNALS